jgi:hypothetical protein
MRIILLMSIDHSAKRPFWKKGKLRDAGKVDLERNRLLQLARKLKNNQIVIEAPGNTSSIVRFLSPFVGRVVVANSILVRALIRCRSRVKGAEFPEATTRPAQARSSVSDTLLRIRSLAGSIIGTLESRFRKRHA